MLAPGHERPTRDKRAENKGARARKKPSGCNQASKTKAGNNSLGGSNMFPIHEPDRARLFYAERRRQNPMIKPPTSTDFGTTARPASTFASEGTYANGRSMARLSWSSVFAGAVIALAIQLVLTLIGAALGLAILDPVTGDNPSPAAFGFGAGMWLFITSVISLLIGGYLAARMDGGSNGWLHGLTTWAVVTLLTLIFLSTAVGGLIGTGSGLVNFVSSDAAASELRRATRQAANRTNVRTPDAPAAEAAAEGGAAGAGAAALGLILGALAAAFGGKKGERGLRRRSAFLADQPNAATTSRQV